MKYTVSHLPKIPSWLDMVPPPTYLQCAYWVYSKMCQMNTPRRGHSRARSYLIPQNGTLPPCIYFLYIYIYICIYTVCVCVWLLVGETWKSENAWFQMSETDAVSKVFSLKMPCSLEGYWAAPNTQTLRETVEWPFSEFVGNRACDRFKSLSWLSVSFSLYVHSAVLSCVRRRRFSPSFMAGRMLL